MARVDIILVGDEGKRVVGKEGQASNARTTLLGKRAMNGAREIALPPGISIVRKGQPYRVPGNFFSRMAR